MKSQVLMCPDCEAQSLRDLPHTGLQLISHVPALGGLFRCRACSTYWEQNPLGDWEAFLTRSCAGENESGG